jgi:hypothetical protein
LDQKSAPGYSILTHLPTHFLVFATANSLFLFRRWIARRVDDIAVIVLVSLGGYFFLQMETSKDIKP